jgi:type III secretory pathway component EscT
MTPLGFPRLGGWELIELPLLATVLGAARSTPVIWLMAPLGGPRLPAAVRVGFAFLLAAVAAPVLIGAVDAARLTRMPALGMSLLLAREIAIGLCLGFVASAGFRAAEIAGRLVDTLRGASIAEVLVPTSEERASPLGALYVLLATLVFLQIGGVQRTVEALLSSYAAVPLAGGLDAGSARRAALVVVEASARLIASGLALAAPPIVAIWLTDLALGLVARAAPQIPVYFVGLPLKGLLAIALVLVGLGALQSAFAADSGIWLRLLGQAVSALGIR